MRDEIFRDCLKEKNSGKRFFWASLAEKWGYKTAEQMRSAFRDEANRRGIGKSKVQREAGEFRKYQNGTYSSDKLVEMFEDDMNDDRKLLEAHNLDPNRWTLIDAISNMWHALRTGDRGRVIQFQSKIRVKPKEVQEIRPEDIAAYYKDKKFVTPIKFPKVQPASNLILEWDITDCHIGARWYNKNWGDLEQIFPVIASDVLDKIGNRKFKKILLPFLGDIFHYQGRNPHTERHGQLVESNGMTPLELFDFAKNVFIGAIDQLLMKAPVEIVYIPGNHDGDALYYFLDSIASWYRNTSTFSANLKHDSQKYYVIGRNLLGLEHGDAPKKNRVHWLQVVAREAWGSTQYAEVHNGHLHSEEVAEYGGIKLRRLPAIAPTDFWHHRNEYVGAIRASMCFVWDENKIGWTEMWQSTGI